VNTDPTPEVLAAIVAAVEVAWPQAVVVEPARDETPSAWRFSGRWWSGPHPVQRRRPWVERP
jgi:hypothetical protein